ncbi:T-complex protein 11-domain-containing protein [Aspergillus californicus]
MDLQKTKEAQGPLAPFTGKSLSKDSPKNDSLGHRPDKNNAKESADGPHRATSPSPSQSSSVTTQCSRSSPSSKAINIPPALGLGSREIDLLATASRSPPITKGTLSELDLPCIMSNINLRMDANFDRDLHFQPVLDGEKGRKKRKAAADYWEAMAVEVNIYAFCASCEMSDIVEDNLQEDKQPSFEPRLPGLFETLQDVLKSLVPERDHPTVMQNLEVALLMQQIQKGVLDMVVIVRWLAALLKTHCAPMRDELADRMVEQIATGSKSQNASEIVRGLHTLFAILEVMKLDVANHQIRAFRVLLVEDTIPFLQEHFRNKIEKDNFQVESSRLWYQGLRERELQGMEDQTQTDGFWPLSLLFQGLGDLLLQFHSPEGFPETFVFDSVRLWRLRTCLQNAINLKICWCIFESFVHSQRRYLPTPAQTYASFRSRIGTLMEENDDCTRGSPRWLSNVRCIALEIARFANTACCGDATISDDMISQIEALLEWHLSNEHGLFHGFQSSFKEKLLEATFGAAKRFLNMSPLAICESQRIPSGTANQQQCDMERISMRLAHMGVLHWRVWAPILYVRESLQHLARKTGLPCTGTKPVLIANLESGLVPYLSPQGQESESEIKDEKRPRKDNREEEGLSILSIDMGIRNLAFAHLKCSSSSFQSGFLEGADHDKERREQGKGNLILNAWRRISLPLDRGWSVDEFREYLDTPLSLSQLQLGAQAQTTTLNDSNPITDTTANTKVKEKSPFSLPIYAQHAHSIITALLSSYKPTHILIERQRFRSGGGAAVQEWSLRVGVFEGMIWAVLHSMFQQQQQQQHQGWGVGANAGPNWRAFSIEPGRVGRFWAPSDESSSLQSSLPTISATTSTDPSKKKRKSSKEGKKLKIDLVASWLENNLVRIKTDSDAVQPWVDGYLAKWKNEKEKPKLKTKHRATSRSNSKIAFKTNADEATTETKKMGSDVNIDIGKLDDLADCLVQGITWLEWEGMKGRVCRNGVGVEGLNIYSHAHT